MSKDTLLLIGVLAVWFGTNTNHSLAGEYLLEIVAGENQAIMNVRDGEGMELERGQFEEIDGFNLVSIKSLLFSEMLYVEAGELKSCCRRNGRWYSCRDAELSRTLIDNSGEVVAEYVFIEGEWSEVEYTDAPEHPSAVIRQSAQKSYILAVVEKDSQLYGMIISADGTIWYDPEEFAPTGPQQP